MKYLSRTTICTLFEIDRPRWKNRTVGLNIKRITKHNEIVFTYVRKSDGKKSYPDHYYFDGDKINDYPTQVVKTVTLILVPIDNLDILVRGKPPIVEITNPEDMPENIRETFFSESKQLRLL